MAKRVTIDIEAIFHDRTSSGVRAARKNIDEMDKSVKKAKKSVDNLGRTSVSPKIKADDSKFIKAIDRAQKKADRLGKTKISAVLGVVDKATRKIESVINKGKEYGRSKWQALLSIKDQDATTIINNVLNKGRNIAGRMWRATVTVADYATRPLRGIYNMLFNIKTLAMSIFAGVAAKKLVFDPVNLADTIESSKIAFETKLGSESKANDFLNQIYKFDEKSPFNTMQIVGITQQMMNMGWEAQKALSDLEVIGDWAASMGKGEFGIERVTLALGQMRQKGRLSAEEMLQLTEAGVSGWDYLAKSLGKTIPEVREMSEKGEIDVNRAINGIIEGMREFEGAAAANSDRTVKGIMGQVDSLVQTYIKLPWGEGLASGFKEGLGEVRDLLDENKDKFKEWGAVLKEVGADVSNWIAEKMKNAIGIIEDITNSDAYKNASGGKKLGMLWDGLVADPLSEWWNGEGRVKMQDKAVELGMAIGEGILKGITTFVTNHPIASLVLGGGMGLKALGGGSMLAGVPALFGKLGGLGATGNAMVGGSGILGKLATVGYGLKGAGAGAYFGAGMSGAAAAGIGLAGVTGGAVGGVSLISGLSDLYKGFKNDDAAKKASGGWKVGGVAGGAVAGAAIGSFVPVIGTALGGLVGAGIGGIAGWWKGNKEAEKYSESVEKASKATEKTRAELEKLANASLDKHMGKLALSADDLEIAINKLFGTTKVSKLNATAKAIAKTQEAYEGVKAYEDNMKKSLWLATLSKDTKMAKADIDSLKSSAKAYSDSASSYLKDSQYAATESITMLMGNSDKAKELIESTNKYYKDQQSELSGLSSELSKTLNNALSDGVISVNEEASLQKIREQIAEITAQIAQDEYEADMNILKAKFGGGALNAESFGQLMSGAQESATAMAESYWDAFGQASVGKSQEEINALKEGLYEQLSTIQLDVGNLGLDTMKEQYAEELGMFGKDLGELFKDGVTPEIRAAMSSLTQDEGTMAAIGKFIEQLAPTTEQVEDLIAKYEEIGAQVPQALTDYMNQVNFYEALSGGFTEAMEFLNTQPFTINPPTEVDPRYSYAPYDPKKLIASGELPVPPYTVNPEYKYNPFNALLLNPVTSILRPPITINPQYTYIKPKIPGSFRGGVYGGAFAEGGYVHGGAQLITVAEEGTPEAIIPLGSHRRSRALELFNEVGERIGAPGFSAKKFAAGGIVGGSSSAPSSGGNGVNVEVGGVTISINAKDGQGMLESIRDNKEAIAEELAGVFTTALKGQFANTPA